MGTHWNIAVSRWSGKSVKTLFVKEEAGRQKKYQLKMPFSKAKETHVFVRSGAQTRACRRDESHPATKTRVTRPGEASDSPVLLYA